MSWLSDLKYSNRLEHLYAMIAGDEELDETVPSTYDRKQGFLYKIAQKIAELSEGGGGGAVTVVTLDEVGEGLDAVLTANKTASEIITASKTTGVVFTWIDEVGNEKIFAFGGEMRNAFNGNCRFSVIDPGSADTPLLLVAETLNDYPTELITPNL